jgi:predicted nucleic acid-binding protein
LQAFEKLISHSIKGKRQDLTITLPLKNVLLPLWEVMPTAALYQRGLMIQSRYQYSFYDALIIAAALGAGCKILYSEDLQRGLRIGGLTIENPFGHLDS